MKKKNLTLIIVASIISLIVIGAIFAQVIIKTQIQNTVEQATLDIISIDVLETTNSSLDLGLNISIENPDKRSAEMEAFTVSLTYGESILGHVTIPALDLKSGSNIFHLNTTLTPISQEIFNDFVSDYVALKTLSLQIDGETIIKAKVGLLNAKSDVAVSKELTLSGMDNFKDMKISKIELLNNTYETESEKKFEALNAVLNTKVYVDVNNPSEVEATLTNVGFNLTFEGNFIGNISFETLELKKGVNSYFTYLGFRLSNLTASQLLVSNFLNDINSTISVVGQYKIDVTGLLDQSLNQITFDTVLAGEGLVTVEMNQFSLEELLTDSIVGNTNITIHNPTNVYGNISEILLDVIYESQKLGTLVIPGLVLVSGSNIYITEFTLTPEDNQVLKNLASTYLDGNKIELIVKGAETGNSLSSLLAGWQQVITFQSSGTFEISVYNVGILNSTTESVFIQADVAFFNPTSVQVELNNASFEVYWDDEAVTLGTIQITNLTLETGYSNVTRAFELIPDDNNLINTLIGEYLNGSQINITVIGLASDDSLLSTIISGYSVAIVLPPISPVDIMVIDLRIVNASTDSLTIEVAVNITNPSSSTVTIDNLKLQTSYGENILGNITLPTLNVLPGIKTYVMNVSFTVSNASLLDELLTEYLQGNDIYLSLDCVSVDVDVAIFETIIKKYTSDVKLPNLDFDISIDELGISNTTADTIEIQLNITMVNPVDFTFDLENITLNLFYLDCRIGNATITTLSLVTGDNFITVDGILTADVNRTNLELFLSNYVGGNNVIIDIQGTFTSDFSGIITPLELPINATVLLIGLEQFVQSIIVNSINIDITVSMTGTISLSYTVDLSVNVINPLTFDITLLDWGGDIYFDDPDSSTYLTLSYAAKYNIYLTTINKTDVNANLPSELEYSLDHTFVGTDLENGIRLNDQLEKDNLYIDMRNGWLNVQIGDFEILLDFEVYDVYVAQ